MVHVSSTEVKYVAEKVLKVGGVDYDAVEEMIPLIETSCSAAGALATYEKAEKRAEEYAADVVKMQERCDAMEGEEKEKETSRIANATKQAKEKEDLAAQAKAYADKCHTAAQAASGKAYVSWPLFVTMVSTQTCTLCQVPMGLTAVLIAQMAHKMGNDTAFVLGYSTIQLNTDAHNPKLDDASRMTKKMFIENNRRSPDLACLADSFVGQLYDEIAGEEIKILDEDDLAAMDGGEVGL
eukprot:SAG31_NODE_32_length_32319_cov_28.042681_13_plen_239_part_00